jgi:hypothetical protein
MRVSASVRGAGSADSRGALECMPASGGPRPQATRARGARRRGAARLAEMCHCAPVRTRKTPKS